MDQAAALDFMGLLEPLTEESILNKYNERFNYFHMLYANAPNKVIEKIQQQNLEKLNQAKKILLDGVVSKKKEFNDRFVSQAAPSAPASSGAGEKTEVGWLILHTEDRKTETFPLYEGINYIGRKKKEDHSHEILIQDDPFVSRTHAFIKCKSAGDRINFELYDGDGSKPSVNGVFLNGNHDRIHQSCSLQENDTIQVGQTKLVLKVKKEHRGISGEIQEVLRTDYIRTIDIRK